MVGHPEPSPPAWPASALPPRLCRSGGGHPLAGVPVADRVLHHLRPQAQGERAPAAAPAGLDLQASGPWGLLRGSGCGPAPNLQRLRAGSAAHAPPRPAWPPCLPCTPATWPALRRKALKYATNSRRAGEESARLARLYLGMGSSGVPMNPDAWDGYQAEREKVRAGGGGGWVCMRSSRVAQQSRRFPAACSSPPRRGSLTCAARLPPAGGR